MCPKCINLCVCDLELWFPTLSEDFDGDSDLEDVLTSEEYRTYTAGTY